MSLDREYDYMLLKRGPAGQGLAGEPVGSVTASPRGVGRHAVLLVAASAITQLVAPRTELSAP